MVILYIMVAKKSRKIYKKNKAINQINLQKEHVPLYITIIQYDNDNQGCEPLILLTSK